MMIIESKNILKKKDMKKTYEELREEIRQLAKEKRDEIMNYMINLEINELKIDETDCGKIEIFLMREPFSTDKHRLVVHNLLTTLDKDCYFIKNYRFILKELHKIAQDNFEKMSFLLSKIKEYKNEQNETKF